MTTDAPASAHTRRGGAPLTVLIASLLLSVLIAVHLLGVVLFGLVWNDDPVGVGLAFLAFAIAAAATAVAALPRLLRGERLGWLVVMGWVVAFDYWSVYKVFALPEYEAAPFLLVGLLVAGLLVHPRSTAHVGGLR